MNSAWRWPTFTLAISVQNIAWGLLQPVAGGLAGRFGFRAAFANRHFLVMAGAYCVCGMQLIVLATHLPSYLALCGLDPMLSAEALSVIAVFNVAGSLFFGWAGGRWNKQALLGGLYLI